MDRRIRILPTLVAALVAAVAPASSHAATTLAEFSAGLTPNSKPTGITRGADGNVWVAGLADPGRIVRVTPAGVITEFTDGLSHDAGPLGITAGPDGNVWFTESKRDGIGRITPQGTITEFRLGLSSDSDPQDIVAGPDGNLWFTERAGRIGRITPTGIVTEFSAGMPVGARPRGIATGADGTVWFTDSSSDARIGRITPTGVVTMFDDAIPSNSMPYDITGGSDGNLWFTLTAMNRIGRITPAGVVTLFDGLEDYALPLGAALGPDGQVWVTELGRGRIAAVATDGSIAEDPALLASAALPTGIAAGPGGTVWFTEPGVDLSHRVAGDQHDGDDDHDGFPGAVGVLSDVGPAESDAGLPATGQPSGSASDGPQTASQVADKIDNLDPLLGGAPQDWAMPQQGKTFLVAPVAGQIRVRRPRARHSDLITRASNIPVGSRVDSSSGAVAFVSALKGGRYQLATFKDGRFDVDQGEAGDGITELTLRGKTGCGGNGEPDPLLAAASATRKGAGRRLWASDRGGRFRTHGRDSVATVRGTEWITEDTCEGTKTTVVSGAVSVRDRHTGRTVLVKAGQSYLARRR